MPYFRLVSRITSFIKANKSSLVLLSVFTNRFSFLYLLTQNFLTTFSLAISNHKRMVETE